MIPLLSKVAVRLASVARKIVLPVVKPKSSVRKKPVLKHEPKRSLNKEKPHPKQDVIKRKVSKTETKRKNIKKELRKYFIEEFFKGILKKIKTNKQDKKKERKAGNKKRGEILTWVYKTLNFKITSGLRNSKTKKSKGQGPELKATEHKKEHKMVDYWDRFGTTLNKLKPGAEIKQRIPEQTTLSRSRSSSISRRSS